MTEAKKIRLHLHSPQMERPFTGERYGIRFEDGYAEVEEDNQYIGFLLDMGVTIVEPPVVEGEAPKAAPRKKGELMDAARELGLTVAKDIKVDALRELVEAAELAIAASDEAVVDPDAVEDEADGTDEDDADEGDVQAIED